MVQKIRQSPKLPAETRRQQLLESARKLFVKKGFRATTTEEIARNAGLTKGALYFHFKSKEDILFDLVKTFAAKNKAHLEEELGNVTNLSDVLKLLLEIHRKCDCRDHWETVDIWIQAIRLPKVKRYLNRLLEELVDDVVSQLKKTYRRSEKELRQLAVLIIALHDGLSFVDMIIPSAVDIDRQLEFIGRLTQPTRKKTVHRRKTRKAS
jgi:AcrR family transcriptional regulator